MKFKVGDFVVRVNNDFNMFKVGDVAEILEITSTDNVLVTNEIISKNATERANGFKCYGVEPKNIRKATKLERVLR